MRKLNLRLSRAKKALYLKIADSIRDAISDGLAQPEEFLPSARSLSQELKCNRHTVMAALSELVAEGWLVSEFRKGYRVSSELPEKFFKTKKTPKVEKNRSISPATYRFVRAAAIVQPQMGSHIKYAFLSGMPDLRLFPHDEIRSHFSDALKRSRTKLLGYSDPAGHLPLVKQIEEYLRRVRAVKDRGIVVTNGSQEAIFIAAQLLLKSGDHVAVEASGYTPAWQALRASGASLVGVPVDSQGLDVEALEKLIKKKKIRLIYTTPLHQYPTTVTLSLARRMQLLDVATRHGIPVLEDDYDHEFHYKSQPLAPLASQDPAGVVIYISTFSKVMYPSARVGFMAVPERYHRQFSDFKRIISRQNDVVTQDAVARWMSDGGFERHMRKMRRNYEVRLRALVESLQKLDLKIIEPSGGMALWLDTEQNSGEIAIKAASAGVHVMPEEYFLLKKKKVATHLRLGFANQTPQEIGRGIAILGENILRG